MAIDPKTKQAILDAANAIRQGEQALHDASIDIEDDTLLLKITLEYNHLDSLLQQLVQAQAIADDVDFAAATTAIKAQAGVITADEKRISTVVGDIKAAAKIVGYITQALTYIATL